MSEQKRVVAEIARDVLIWLGVAFALDDVIVYFVYPEWGYYFVKLVAISFITDMWLYWTHRIYHSLHSPEWLRKIHDYHHDVFHRKQLFMLHWVELIIAASVPFAVVSLLISPWFFPVVALWGLFEAARGHGHFKWFRLIPKGYYKKAKFCGINYHKFHHTPEGVNKNYGQMLKIWDKICKTEHIIERKATT